jgi:hypothetical protein
MRRAMFDIEQKTPPAWDTVRTIPVCQCVERGGRGAAYGLLPSCHESDIRNAGSRPARPGFRRNRVKRGMGRSRRIEENEMTVGTILLIVLVLLLIGAIPNWSHSRNWGYGPSGGVGIALLVVVVLLVMGKI